MNRYMLDTNTVSHLVRGHAAVARHIATASISSLCISAVTRGELEFGLARRPDAKRLHRAVRELLLRLDVQPWDGAVAERYGLLRASLARRGKVLAPLDLMIAGHAVAIDAILITSDQAFGQVEELTIRDWTT